MPHPAHGWFARCVACLLMTLSLAPSISAAEFDVRQHGAKADGVTLDSDAINRAIDAAAAAGGGIVRFSAGNYLSFTIRLKSHVTLHLDPGATIVAATPAPGFGGYDAPEVNEWGERHQYQDFGHSHWRNSLIWGDGLTDIAITGAGRIDGTKGLLRNASLGGRGGRAGAQGPNNTPEPGTAAAAARRGAGAPPPRSERGEGARSPARTKLFIGVRPMARSRHRPISDSPFPRKFPLHENHPHR